MVQVLILDDEPLVAMLLTDYLEALGHEVVASVETVADGLSAVGEEAVEFAVLDCRLAGGEHSWPLADHLADAGVPFLFSSGVSRDQLPERHSDRPMLLKPYSLHALKEAIVELEG